MIHKYAQIIGFGAFLVLATFGCDTITGTDEERVPATVYEEMFLEVPEVARSGEDIRIRIATGPFGGCARSGETEVEKSGNIVMVRPYNYRFDRPSGQQCQPGSLEHELTVQFLDVGTVLIRVFGLGFDGDETVIEREILIEE